MSKAVRKRKYSELGFFASVFVGVLFVIGALAFLGTKPTGMAASGNSMEKTIVVPQPQQTGGDVRSERCRTLFNENKDSYDQCMANIFKFCVSDSQCAMFRCMNNKCQ